MAHDLGYDVLRYADRTGQPLGAAARRSIDERLAHAMIQRCHDIGDPVGCAPTAWLYAEGVRFNTWRQSGAAPRAETAGQWLDHLWRALRADG